MIWTMQSPNSLVHTTFRPVQGWVHYHRCYRWTLSYGPHPRVLCRIFRCVVDLDMQRHLGYKIVSGNQCSKQDTRQTSCLVNVLVLIARNVVNWVSFRACSLTPVTRHRQEYGFRRTLDWSCAPSKLEFSMDMKEILYTFESGTLKIRELN